MAEITEHFYDALTDSLPEKEKSERAFFVEDKKLKARYDAIEIERDGDEFHIFFLFNGEPMWRLEPKTMVDGDALRITCIDGSSEARLSS